MMLMIRPTIIHQRRNESRYYDPYHRPDKRDRPRSRQGGDEKSRLRSRKGYPKDPFWRPRSRQGYPHYDQPRVGYPEDTRYRPRSRQGYSDKRQQRQQWRDAREDPRYYDDHYRREPRSDHSRYNHRYSRHRHGYRSSINDPKNDTYRRDMDYDAYDQTNHFPPNRNESRYYDPYHRPDKRDRPRSRQGGDKKSRPRSRKGYPKDPFWRPRSRQGYPHYDQPRVGYPEDTRYRPRSRLGNSYKRQQRQQWRDAREDPRDYDDQYRREPRSDHSRYNHRYSRHHHGYRSAINDPRNDTYRRDLDYDAYDQTNHYPQRRNESRYYDPYHRPDKRNRPRSRQGGDEKSRLRSRKGYPKDPFWRPRSRQGYPHYDQPRVGCPEDTRDRPRSRQGHPDDRPERPRSRQVAYPPARPHSKQGISSHRVILKTFVKHVYLI